MLTGFKPEQRPVALGKHIGNGLILGDEKVIGTLAAAIAGKQADAPGIETKTRGIEQGVLIATDEAGCLGGADHCLEQRLIFPAAE